MATIDIKNDKLITLNNLSTFKAELDKELENIGSGNTNSMEFASRAEFEAAYAAGEIPEGTVCYIQDNEEISVYLTQAQYDELVANNQIKSNVTYFTESDMGAKASYITYNNENSGLQATDVQEAIDEVNSNILALADYSTTEKVIGKWVNDETLYERCVMLTNVSSSTKYYTIPNFTANKIIDYKGTLTWDGTVYMSVSAGFLTSVPWGVGLIIDTTGKITIYNSIGVDLLEINLIITYIK